MGTTTEITNSDDIIDSRDVIARIEELEELKGDAGLDDSEQRELDALCAFAREGADFFADWFHGEVFVRDSYFVDYAEQLAEDIGAINQEYSWPLSHIDWEAAANALKVDYTSVEFEGVTYWARS